MALCGITLDGMGRREKRAGISKRTGGEARQSQMGIHGHLHAGPTCGRVI